MQRFRSANIVSLKTAHVGGKMKYLKDKKAVLKGYLLLFHNTGEISNLYPF